MTREELHEYIASKHPEFKIEPLAFDLTFLVPVEELIPFCTFLQEDEKLLFNNLMCLTAVDNVEWMDVVYHFSSYPKRHRIALKVSVKGENPEVPSVTGLWPGANWHEREVYDLYGVVFLNHPDLRRILLDDQWEGHPMRKNYKHWNLVPLPDDVTEVTKEYKEYNEANHART